jgi:hypothetical protein
MIRARHTCIVSEARSLGRQPAISFRTLLSKVAGTRMITWGLRRLVFESRRRSSLSCGVRRAEAKPLTID